MLFDATINGKVCSSALIKKEDVKRERQKDPERAEREYYNKFDDDNGVRQVFKRAMIVRCSEQRAPVLFNENNERRFMLSFDPARTYDQSVITIAELKEHKDGGFKAEICNCMSLIDSNTKKKKPESAPDQVKAIKQILLDYNGANVPDYDNIDSISIDAGSGGGGRLYADLLMENWFGEDGVEHRGMIDEIQDEEYLERFPNASRILKLIEPTKFKRVAFDNLRELLAQGRITFTDEFRKESHSIIVIEKDGKKEKQVERFLTKEEKVALINIELMKSELVDIYRKDTITSYTYDINDEKKGRLYDDRAYTLALIALRLSEINRSHLNRTSKNNTDLLKYIYGGKSMNKQNIFNSNFKGFK